MITKLTTFIITMREICYNAIKHVKSDEKTEYKEDILEDLYHIMYAINYILLTLEH